ncbi:hypothetical protein ROSINTL182_07638 [Roseburia intestinalis L1-82]|uniref:Uncharacterized protein n=1 Tax=Roseburia intestinalis L1-82 TaxID=536231 RepID=C7GCK1_9FIRM|nr:hypothetical protein ROSINTL182_07638 [Roseburia intestinalis L1-82]
MNLIKNFIIHLISSPFLTRLCHPNFCKRITSSKNPAAPIC